MIARVPLSWKLGALFLFVLLGFFLFNALGFHTLMRERFAQRELVSLEAQVAWAVGLLEGSPEVDPATLFPKSDPEDDVPDGEASPGGSGGHPQGKGQRRPRFSPGRYRPPGPGRGFRRHPGPGGPASLALLGPGRTLVAGDSRHFERLPTDLEALFPKAGSRWSGQPGGDFLLAGQRIRHRGEDYLVLASMYVRGPWDGWLKRRRGPPPKPRWGERGERDTLDLQIFLLRGALGLIASLLAGLLGVRLLTGRISELRSGVRRLEEGDMQVRLDPGAEDEVGSLIRAFNSMVESLAAAQEELRGQDRARREMLADVSHELGTPLTSMICNLELLREHEEGLPPEDRKRVQTVLEEGRSLGERIQDLLLLAREEVEALPFRPQTLNLQKFLHELVERLRALCEGSGVTLKTEFLPEIVSVEADPGRLEQVFRNLLENGRRALYQGGEIALRVLPPEQGFLVVEVEDDGPGIPEEELAGLFERFRRGEGAREGGTGLGLAIVRKLVERHGGRCEVESRLGEGTCFRVFLPVAPAPAD